MQINLKQALIDLATIGTAAQAKAAASIKASVEPSPTNSPFLSFGTFSPKHNIAEFEEEEDDASDNLALLTHHINQLKLLLAKDFLTFLA
jgi:hypothetical protein